MNIIWDKMKDEWLKLERNISFEEICEKILNKEYIEIIENKARKNQQCFVMNINEYIWIIPFIIENDETIILKTAYPSRKSNKKYGAKK